MAINKKTNGYKVDVSLGIDPITKKQRRIRISGKKVRTKQQAQKLEAKYLRLHHENKLDTPSNLSLTDIYEFYEERHTKNLKPSYIKSQERIFKVYVEPYFKDTTISKIKFTQIRDFQNHLLSLKGKKRIGFLTTQST